MAPRFSDHAAAAAQRGHKPLRLRRNPARPAGRSWAFGIRSGSYAAAPHACALLPVTLRLFTTRGFASNRDTNSRAAAPLGLYPSLRSIRAAHDGSALLGSRRGLGAWPGRFRCDSGHKQICLGKSWFASVAALQAILCAYPTRFFLRLDEVWKLVG